MPVRSTLPYCLLYSKRASGSQKPLALPTKLVAEQKARPSHDSKRETADGAAQEYSQVENPLVHALNFIQALRLRPSFIQRHHTYGGNDIPGFPWSPWEERTRGDLSQEHSWELAFQAKQVCDFSKALPLVSSGCSVSGTQPSPQCPRPGRAGTFSSGPVTVHHLSVGDPVHVALQVLLQLLLLPQLLKRAPRLGLLALLGEFTGTRPGAE